MGTWREVQLDLNSNRPMWYLWPAQCPMMAAKIAAGHPKPMACTGGVQDAAKGLGVFSCCWHTTKDDVAKSEAGTWSVLCTYDPATDEWNHPKAKVDPAAYQVPSFGTNTETLSSVMARVLSGAPEGPLVPREPDEG